MKTIQPTDIPEQPDAYLPFEAWIAEDSYSLFMLSHKLLEIADPQQRLAIVTAMALDGQYHPALLTLLTEGTLRERLEVLRLLQHQPEHIPVPLVVSLVCDADREIRSAALACLIAAGECLSLDAYLVYWRADSKDWRTHQALVKSLSRALMTGRISWSTWSQALLDAACAGEEDLCDSLLEALPRISALPVMATAVIEALLFDPRSPEALVVELMCLRGDQVWRRAGTVWLTLSERARREVLDQLSDSPVWSSFFTGFLPAPIESIQRRWPHLALAC